jgi:hypothetical protein
MITGRVVVSSKSSPTPCCIDHCLDRLLAAVVRQAIRNRHTGPRDERQAAHDYLTLLGLLDDAGEVVQPEVADVTLVWVG